VPERVHRELVFDGEVGRIDREAPCGHFCPVHHSPDPAERPLRKRVLENVAGTWRGKASPPLEQLKHVIREVDGSPAVTFAEEPPAPPLEVNIGPPGPLHLASPGSREESRQDQIAKDILVSFERSDEAVKLVRFYEPRATFDLGIGDALDRRSSDPAATGR